MICSFCGAEIDDARGGVAAPKVVICEYCIRLGLALIVEPEAGKLPSIAGPRRPPRRADSDNAALHAMDWYRCSFCQRHREQAGPLMVGREKAHICRSC